MKLISVIGIEKRRVFRAIFFCVLLLVFGSSVFAVFLHKGSASRTAMISLRTTENSGHYGVDPFITEFEIILSEDVLTEAAANLNLSLEWAKYNRGMPLDQYRVVTRLRKKLNLRRYNAATLEICAQGDTPEEAARIANEVASVYCEFHLRNPGTPDFVTVSVASAAEATHIELLRGLRLPLELCLAMVLALAAAFGAVGVIHFVFWVLGVKYPVNPHDLFSANFSGKIVGLLWIFVGGVLGSFGCGWFAVACWNNRSIVLFPIGIVSAFWVLNCVVGFFLARNNVWARIYIIVFAACITFLPSATRLPHFSFFQGDFVWFGIGSICALLLPQKIEGAPT